MAAPPARPDPEAPSRESELPARQGELEAELATLRGRVVTVWAELKRERALTAAKEEELASMRGRLVTAREELTREQALVADQGEELTGLRRALADATTARDRSAESEGRLERQKEVLERKLASLLETHRRANEELTALKRAPATEPPAPTVAAAEPVPAAVTEPAPVTSPPRPARAATSAATEVRAMVASWARSWSDQDVDGYLSHYSRGFAPGKGLEIAAWRQQRRQRISAPRSVSVAVESLEVSVEADGRATAVFRQSYRSDTFADWVIKTLQLVREEGSWRIARETSRPVG